MGTFCQFIFGALSLFSLSHSWTLRSFLENSSIGLRKEKEGPRRKRKANIKQGREASSSYSGIICRYRFACVISLLDLACMYVFGSLDIIGMGFASEATLFRLSFPFPNIHGVMGSLVLVELYFQMVVNLSEVVSERKNTRPRDPWIGLVLW